MLKTLTTLLLSAIIFIEQFGCKPGRESKKSTSIKEFEGIIAFHEISKTSDSSINLDDTVQLFYANGNYVSIHSEASQKIHII